MTQIISDKNNGSANGTLLGMVQIGWNVCPDSITAAPTAATLTQAQLNKYNYFNLLQTDADTDEFDLPALADIGDMIALYSEEVVEIRTTTEADLINAVGSQGFTTTAGDLVICIKVAAAAWYVFKFLAADGAVTSIVPGVAA